MSPQDRKHGREAARRRAAQAVARAEARRRQQRMRVVIAAILAVVVVLAVVLVSAGGGDDTTSTASDSSSTTSPESGTTASTSPATTEVPAIPSVDGVFQYGKGECPPDTPPSTPKRHFTSSPKRCLEDGVDYRAVVETSEGSFTFDLLEKDAPGTVNNFVVLARWGFFDGLTFHRVAPNFVIQGGDPNGDGSGGPGYAIADELPSDVSAYKPGAVAMANSGPDTNGSQFFVCSDCSGLPTAGYSLFGQVVDGTDVVQAIESLGTSDGPPSKTVTIEKVTIQEA